MQNNDRFVCETRPLALSENMIVGEQYRFTILTPSLIRMEYSATGVFEDRASQSVFFRDFPKTDFVCTKNEGVVNIATANVTLTYSENKPFAEDTLCIRLNIEPASTWHFGEPFETLKGTAKTLDEANGAIPLGDGVCSRNGFSVTDDSNTLLLNEHGWVEVRIPNTVDYYFWGYGFEYTEAVKDLYRLTGAAPLLPAYALGNWWSRYHDYTQDEYQDLILRFEEEKIPFSVSVVDMDWHYTEVPEDAKDEITDYGVKTGLLPHDGWTGYSWNKALFPDYKGFLKFLKQHNLKTSLNLHPSDGVRCHEDMYEEMALSCGIDPATKKRVPLDILSPAFMEKYFDILHHPYEEDGVNFWWMDWQQGGSYWWIHKPNENGELQDEREVLDPLWMLNHLHIIDIQRNRKRPMFFSRFSGLGSHRYPVGFSGDTYVTWESLDFQPYFTATSSNVGYSWWSHDIGGHMGGYLDEELTVRWLQLGVFSPINRLHSSNTDFIRKEPWCYSKNTETIMKEWLRLRHELFPYIYTMNYRNHTDLIPLIQPMYYAYPKRSGAYEQKNQFRFGSELMIAPITRPNNTITQTGQTKVWFPEGDWFDFFNGTHYESTIDRTITVSRSLEAYPVFAKAGAIIPTQTDYDLKSGSDLKIFVFPGKDNSFTLYEDAGDGSEFKNGEFVQTEMNLEWNEIPRFIIRAAKGKLELLPKERSYQVVFRGFHKDIQIGVSVNGKEISADVCYDEDTLSSVVTVTADVASEIEFRLSADSLITENRDVTACCSKVLQKAHMDGYTKGKVLKALENKTFTFARKRRLINSYCAGSVERQAVVEALLEQLTLVESY